MKFSSVKMAIIVIKIGYSLGQMALSTQSAVINNKSLSAEGSALSLFSM